MKALHQELESSVEERRPYMTTRNARAADARLTMLRAVWTLLLDRADE